MKKLTMIAMSMAMLSVVSCSKGDLYDEGAIAEREAAQAAVKEADLLDAYKADFVKTYGEVKPDQTWDFAYGNVSFQTGSSKAATRGAGVGTRGVIEDFLRGIWETIFGSGHIAPSTPQVTTPEVNPISVDGNWYVVPQKTRSLMNTVFGEGKNNTQKLMEGTFIELNVPKNDFYILPIYMGQSGGDFKLCMHVEGVSNDVVVWSKWDNVQYKENANSDWKTLNKDNSRNGYNLVDVSDIRTKPIKISVKDLPENASMHFYLLITEQASDYNHLGDKLSCLNGYIKEYAFNSDEVDMTGLPGYDASKGQVQCKFFGCEDASTSKTDKDFNDVVFLAYGQPQVPQSTKVEDLTMVKSKRYMIEDLGMANDKDFNDIVVDVVQTFEAQIKTYDDGTPLSGYENPDYQLKSTTAAVRALGGRYDFELKIGNTTWKKSDTFEDFTQMMGTTAPDLNAEPLHVIENVSGFDMNANNIELTVFNEEGKVARKVDFPNMGDIPLMIATPLSIIWSKEKVKFPFETYEGSADASKE